MSGFRFQLSAWCMGLVFLSGMTADIHAEEPANSSPQGSAAESALTDWQRSVPDYARILSEVKWKPVADSMPDRRGGFFQQSQEYTGVPYSSVRSEGRYIGFDVSLRTFLAAVENPQSVLYTENLTGKVSNAATFYGTVCSSFTSYALQCALPEVSRRYGPEVSTGVIQVESQSAETAQVGDVIYTPHQTPTSGSHVEIVTDVTRDDQGRVVSVRVEESRPLTTKTTVYTPAKFNAHLAARDKQLIRVTDLDAWRAGNRAEAFLFPNPQADAVSPQINRSLLLDLGDWVPYSKGEPVKFHVMDRDQRGVKTLVVQRGGKPVEEIPLEGTGVVERTFSTCGDYTAHVIHADGSTSQACEFAICDLELKLPGETVPLDEDWDVAFTAENMRVIAVYLWNSADSYGRHPLFIPAEQGQAGSVTVPKGLLKKPGTLQVWLIGEHPLGRLKTRQDVTLTR